MPESQDQIRLSKAAKEFNVGFSTLVEFLTKKNLVKESLTPNSKISGDIYEILEKEFMKDKAVKEESRAVGLTTKAKREVVTLEEKAQETPPPVHSREKESEEILIKDVTATQPVFEAPPPAPEKPQEPTPAPEPEKQPEPEITASLPEPEPEVIKPKTAEMKGPVVKGKIDLSTTEKKKSTKPGKKSGESKKEEQTQPPLPTPQPQEPVAAPVEEQIPVAEPVQTPPVAETPKAEESPKPAEREVHVTQYGKLEGPTILGKIELKDDKKKPSPVASSSMSADQKKKRKRIKKGPITNVPEQSGGSQGGGQNRHKPGDRKPDRRQPNVKQELTQEEIDNKIKETLARLSGQGKSASSKYRRQKRENISQQIQEELEQQAAGKRILKVTEFISANELASLMNVPVNQVISTCMSLGMFVSINQRLSAEIPLKLRLLQLRSWMMLMT
jgi:translation initiation factor IF-2